MSTGLLTIRRPASTMAPRPRTDGDVTDCLIIGFNDIDVSRYVNLVRSMGTDSGAYRDLALALVEHEGRLRRSMDLLNDFHFAGRERPPVPLNNADFLWPTITYLGPYLDKRGFTFDYINLFQLEKEKLRQKLLRGNVRAVAITTTLYVIPEPVVEIIEFVRAHGAQTKIIVGGPFIANNTSTLDRDALERFFKMLGADFYVDSSEGEQALANLLTALKTGGDLASIDNLAYRSGDGYVTTQKSIERSDLGDEPIRYDLFGRDVIGQFVSIRTAKSCPFSCSFCGFPARAGKYVYLGVEHVEAELNALRDLGSVTTISFLDDTFNVPKDRFKQLLRMMIKNKYGFRWNSFYRADHGDEETVALMAEAGCEGVFLGIESGSDAILTRMAKTSRRKHYMRTIPWMRKYGILTHANFIVGFPGETLETFQESVDLVEEARPDFYRAQLWYADPITPVWKRKEELGIKGAAFNWSHDTMDSRTASDLVEKMFCCIENSVWLPQYGFELWSVFYLQRFGMSREQLKTFLRCFNTIIRERLVRAPHEAAPPPALMQALERSAQFDRGVAPDLAAVDEYRGAAYTAAEPFWGEMFRACPQGRALPRRAAAAGPAERWDVRPFTLDGETSWRLLGGPLARDAGAAVLAATALVLTRVSGRDDAALLVSTPSSGRPPTFWPLRLRPGDHRDHEGLAEAAGRLLKEGGRLGRFAFHLLTNALRMERFEAKLPSFDVGLIYSRPGEGQEPRDGDAPPQGNGKGSGNGHAHGHTNGDRRIEDSAHLIERCAVPGRPELTSELALVIEVMTHDGGLSLALHHRPSALQPAEVDQLGALLLGALSDAASSPDQPLQAPPPAASATARAPAVQEDAAEDFNF